jgi:hypothetical protein
MKPIATTSTQVDNLPGEEVKFTISEANQAWVMRSMADLYSNRELAVIREYSTNARDAMIEADKADEPIRVTLPNAMNPYFKVQDFGIGMDKQTLKEVYTKFGESTKRETDAQNGMLGFGSKSAVAYTNQFTVTAVKNGRKTIAIITRHEDAMGGYVITLKIAMEVDTVEDNGVTIEVPVHNWQEFERKARDFYRYWIPGTVIVNGKTPEWAVGEKIDEDLYYNEKNDSSYVVMGNVPYRIENPNALFPSGMNRISFVAYIPMGYVEFTPNREALKYSEYTKKNLHKIIDDFVSRAKTNAAKEIGAATTHADAYIAWDKWRGVLGAAQVADLTFKGEKFVDQFPIIGYRYDTNQYRYGTHAVRTYSVSSVKHTIIVTDFPNIIAAPSASQKKKVRSWRDHKNITANYFLFVTEPKIDNVWVDQSRVVSWETIKAEAPKDPKKPRAVNVNPGRRAGTFDLVDPTIGRTLYSQDVPNTKDLYYIMVAEYNGMKERGSGLDNLLRVFDFKHKVVKVPANRKDKFLREYPHAKHIMSTLESLVELDGMKLLSADAQTYLRTSTNEINFVSNLDISRIQDPDLLRYYGIYSKDRESYLKEYNRQFSLAKSLGIIDKFKRHPWDAYGSGNATPIMDVYPLLRKIAIYNMNYQEHTHLYHYINSVYNARKDGKNV